MIDAFLGQQFVHGQLAGQPGAVEIGQLRRDCVNAEVLDFAADIYGAVIHGIAEVFSGIAADHDAPALHHEPGKRAGIAADDDGAALLVDAGARADRTLAHQIAAAQRGAEGGAGILLDHAYPGHHVLAERPADAAGNPDNRAVEQAAAEIAQTAFDDDVHPVEDADDQRMLGARIPEHDAAVTGIHQVADFPVDFRGLQLGAVDFGAPVEVDVPREVVGETAFVLERELGLDVPAGQGLGMHAHLCGDGVAHACHTRTSSS